eukprot:TRINITY_DN104497_c0_g1_i2.p1 TRINITY_DN104497_c0_g1~~TRINITY_DN104497_c0_g1_i2.p1  ORF type:complete len:115 (-),score=15.81 TRINITY_DN104497_c0_g1_i2:528-872(-)
MSSQLSEATIVLDKLLASHDLAKVPIDVVQWEEAYKPAPASSSQDFALDSPSERGRQDFAKPVKKKKVWRNFEYCSWFASCLLKASWTMCAPSCLRQCPFGRPFCGVSAVSVGW